VQMPKIPQNSLIWSDND